MVLNNALVYLYLKTFFRNVSFYKNIFYLISVYLKITKKLICFLQISMGIKFVKIKLNAFDISLIHNIGFLISMKKIYLLIRVMALGTCTILYPPRKKGTVDYYV